MIFLIVFSSWALEFSYLQFAPLRGRRWVIRWYGWLERAIGPRRRYAWIHVGLTLALPCALMAIVFNSLLVDSSFLSLVGGVAVLVYCCGVGDLTTEIESYTNNSQDATETTTGASGAHVFAAVSASLGNPDRPFTRALARAANGRIFAPTFWFIVLGPLGALLYCLSATLSGLLSPSVVRGEIVHRLQAILQWLPARLFALSLGIAGTLAPVLSIVGSPSYALSASDKLIEDAALAALNPQATAVDASDSHIVAIAQMWRLLKRGFVVCLVILGLLAAADVV